MTRRITVRSGSVPRKVIPPASAGTAAGVDTDAIHDNIAAEISDITAKATPINADFLLIEDSAAGDAKKKITIGDLPSSGTSPLTTKGDLFGYDTNIARIPIGSNDQILTADSTQTLGVKWAGLGDTIVPAFGDTYKTGTMSTSAFPWKGTSVIPARDTTLYALVHYGEVVSGATYQAAVITISGGTIATIEKTESITPPAAQVHGNLGRLTFVFATPIDLTADTTYYLAIGRTDSTDTFAFEVGFNAIVPFFFGATSGSASIKIAKANPAVSDAVDLTSSSVTTSMGAFVVQDGLRFTP